MAKDKNSSTLQNGNKEAEIPPIKKVKKRDGRVVKYRREKITNAIYSSLISTNKKPKEENLNTAKELAKIVEDRLKKIFAPSNLIPKVEDIQDIVEATLLEKHLFKALKHYVEYRQDHRFIREEKKRILNKDSLDKVEKRFSLGSIRILESRYLIKDENGKVIESVSHLLTRSAVVATLPEFIYDSKVFERYSAKDIPIIEPMLPKYKYRRTTKIYDPEVKEFINKLKPKLKGIPKTIEDIHSGYKLGNFDITYSHLERLASLYDEVKHTTGRIKVSWGEFMNLLSDNYFDKYYKLARKFYDLMANQDFLPNSPTLMNAGYRLGQLSACFVVDMEDDLTSILETNAEIGLIFQSGGGVGCNYSKLRPEGDVVSSTMGVSSGPLSFMQIVNTTTEVIKQGGKRRGANMGILDVYHPDIQKFITIKEDLSQLNNFNLSVGMWDIFWKALRNKEPMPLINPRNNTQADTIKPDLLFDQIALSAWKSAEPGVIFFDNVNRHNILEKTLGKIRATNPCGEEPLYPYESCNLGSINLANFVVERGDQKFFNTKRFISVLETVTRFMDNIISINKYPLHKIRRNTVATRKIGIGIMGLADLLYKLKIPYNSKKAYDLMDEIAENLAYYSMKASVELAKEKGAFALFDKSGYIEGKVPLDGLYDGVRSPKNDWISLIEDIKTYGIRDSYTTTIAPTGSISMIADTSSGLEPQFALVYKKNVSVGSFYMLDNVFNDFLMYEKHDYKKLRELAAQNYGAIGGLDEYFTPEEQAVFVTSQEIHWIDHIVAQFIWQRWNSSSISKTINMPNHVTPTDIKQAYLMGHELGLKGLTIFRDGSRYGVIQIDGKQREYRAKPSKYALELIESIMNKDTSIYAYRSDFKQELLDLVKEDNLKISETGLEPEVQEKRCPLCGGKVIKESGCEKCVECGWSACTVS